MHVKHFLDVTSSLVVHSCPFPSCSLENMLSNAAVMPSFEIRCQGCMVHNPLQAQ